MSDMKDLVQAIVDAINAERRISKLEVSKENQEKKIDGLENEDKTLHSRITGLLWWFIGGFGTLLVVALGYFLNNKQ